MVVHLAGGVLLGWLVVGVFPKIVSLLGSLVEINDHVFQL